MPAVASGITARARFTLHSTNGELVYDASVFGVRDRDIIGTHLHRGGREVTGPIVFILGGPGAARASGTLKVSPRDLQDLAQGNMYLDLHT